MIELGDLSFLIKHQTDGAIRALLEKEQAYRAMHKPTDYEIALDELNEEYPGLRYG